ADDSKAHEPSLPVRGLYVRPFACGGPPGISARIVCMDETFIGLLFTQARTHRRWLDRPVDDELLRRIYELARWPPTSANIHPRRLVCVKSREGKERLRAALDPQNVEQTMTAPVTAIVAYDTRFYELLPRLAPSRPEMAERFASRPEAIRERLAFQSGTL